MDKLESLIETSTRVPGTRRTLVDTDKLLELLDQMRLAIPQDVKAAQEILHRKELLYTQAQQEARKIRATAEEEFRARIDSSEVQKAAQRRSAELLEEAQRKAQRMLDQANAQARNRMLEADLYSAEVLKKLERQLATLLGTVRRGLDSLEPPEGEEELLNGNGVRNGKHGAHA